MSNDQSSPQGHQRPSVSFPANEDNVTRRSSIQNLDGKRIQKSVSFSGKDMVHVIPNENQPAASGEPRGLFLEERKTHKKLLDDTFLKVIDEESEKEQLSTILSDQVFESVPPSDLKVSRQRAKEAVVFSNLKVADSRGEKGMFPVGLSLKRTPPKTDVRVDKTIRKVLTRSSYGGTSTSNMEESRKKWFEKRPVEESMKQKRCRRFKKEYQDKTVKGDSDQQRQEELLGNIGSRTRDAIRDYIVGLSGESDPNRFSSVNLVAMFVAVKGTLSRNVIRKENKSKMGLDLVESRTLRNQNLNCVVNFYYDKDAKEIAEGLALDR